MIELLTSAEAWAALLTLTALEIVLGIDNVIFLSVIVSRIPRAASQTRAADRAVAGAGVPHPSAQPPGLADRADAAGADGERPCDFSWRDIILIGGGLFLIAQGHPRNPRRGRGARGGRGAGRACERVLLGDRPDHRHRPGVLAGLDHHCDRHGAGYRDHDRGRRDRLRDHVRLVRPSGAIRR